MAEPGPGARKGAGFQPARNRPGIGANVRLVLGLVVVLVVVLSALALFQSLFIEPRRGVPPGTTPAPGQQTAGAAGGGGGGVTCDDVTTFLQYTFILLAVATITLFAVAVARRHKSNGRIATSVWGVLAIIGFFFSLLTLGAWRLVDVLCHEDLNCRNVTDGSFTVFLVLLGLTLGALALGMAIAHRTRGNFFLTGWGIVSVVLYVPTLLAGFFWYIVRLLCTRNLSCSLRTEFLETLAWIFWLSLIAGAAAIALGWFIKRRLKLGLFASGWAPLAILLLVLSAFTGFGYLQVKDTYIPYCDGPPQVRNETEQNTTKTCEDTKRDIQSRLMFVFWTLVGIAVASSGAGFFFHRTKWRAFFRSGWAIAAYIALALAALVLLLNVLADSMCGGEGGDTQGEGNRGQPGDGGRGRSGGGGGGGGFGPGGGGGGVGSAPSQIPLTLSSIPLVWVLAILGGIVALALLYLLFKHKKKVELGDFGAPQQPPDVEAAERAQLLHILEQGKLSSHEAVIAAYRSFLAWAAARSMEKFAHETPLEHAERVRKQYPVPQDSMRAFIRAYEVARLSAREPTPEERKFAVRFSKDIDTVGWSQASQQQEEKKE